MEPLSEDWRTAGAVHGPGLDTFPARLAHQVKGKSSTIRALRAAFPHLRAWRPNKGML